MAVSHVLLVLGMVALYSTGQAAGQCNTTALDACLQPFEAYITAFLYYSVNASNIIAACQAYASTSSCVTSQAMCKVTDTAAILDTWTGASAFYTTICNPSGQAQYLEYQPCYAGSYQKNVMVCANISNSVSINANSSAAQQCTSYNSLVACLGSKSAATCNSSAAGQFLTQLIIASYGPLIHLGVPCCTLNGDTTGYVTPASCQATGRAQNRFSMTGVVLAPVILFALLVVVLILCFVSATRHLGLPCCP